MQRKSETIRTTQQGSYYIKLLLLKIIVIANALK